MGYTALLVTLTPCKANPFATMTFDQQQFRHALGHFVTGITVVTTLDPQGQPIGVTANSFNSVSLEPPLVLWSLAKSASTYEAFLAAEHYGVNILAREQVELSTRFASPVDNRFEGLNYQPGGVAGVPLIDGCVARFECRPEHRYEGGDHLIFVARVLAFEFDSDRKALAYYRSRYTQTAD